MKRDLPHLARLTIEPLEPRSMLAAFDVLVFSKTADFRHDAIEPAVAAVRSLGELHDFSVVATENAGAFTPANLVNFDAVVFLLTTGDVLNATQQSALVQFVQAGGGWAGVHSAADTEHEWPWYGALVGAYFESHPAIQQARIVVENRVHPSTDDLPENWVRTDEWYNYSRNPRGDVHVLATLDESTYSDGSDHPVAWYHEYDGGRSWYTGLGHTAASYSEPLFLEHLLGGILYAAGQAPAASADFDRNGVVDGADFLRWQRGLGSASGATLAQGDASGDGRVNGDDLERWRRAFGFREANVSAATSAGAAVEIAQTGSWLTAPPPAAREADEAARRARVTAAADLWAATEEAPAFRGGATSPTMAGPRFMSSAAGDVVRPESPLEVDRGGRLARGANSSSDLAVLDAAFTETEF